jgi:CDP-paratose 2-epimerase
LRKGTGKQVRDALHIEDFCSAIAWEMQNFDKVDGQMFNIGGGRDCSFSLLELTQLCENSTGMFQFFNLLFKIDQF